MNFVAAHCQRSKDLWTRMLAECQQRQANDLITTCYNNSKLDDEKYLNNLFVYLHEKKKKPYRYA